MPPVCFSLLGGISGLLQEKVQGLIDQAEFMPSALSGVVLEVHI